MTEDYFISSTNNFVVSLMPGEVLFKKGVSAESIFYVITGKLIILEPFSSKIIREYSKDELLGVSEVLIGEKWEFMAEAKAFSCIQVFPKSALLNCLNQLSTGPKTIINYLLRAA